MIMVQCVELLLLQTFLECKCAMCVRVCVCRVSEGLFQIAQNVLSADEELLLGNRARDRMGKTEQEEGAENCGSWRKEWEKELEGGGGLEP